MLKKLIIFLTVVVMSFCFLTACGDKNEMTGWKIELKKSDSYFAVNYFTVSLAKPTDSTAGNKYIKGIWVNADGAEELDLRVIFATNSTIKNELTISSSMKEENVTLNLNDEKNGWINIMPLFAGFGTSNYDYSYVKFEIVNSVTINEIVFTTSADERFNVTIEEQGLYPEGATNSQLEYTLAELQEKKESKELENSVLNVFDEQDKFVYSEVAE